MDYGLWIIFIFVINRMNANNYVSTLRAIEFIKINFQKMLCKQLNLVRVSAPLFLTPESGLNDDLNGIERKVSFVPATMTGSGKHLEVVQSLAKWKRWALWKYDLAPIYGIVADMNAIRQDETIDKLHSIYVDQWDWELPVMARSNHLLHAVASIIFDCIKKLDVKLTYLREPIFNMTDKLYFITSEELYEKFPHLNSKERENAICKQYKAVFIEQIGNIIPGTNNKRHDFRAPDYDDWELNGDILVWSDVINEAIELSSMGIRVNAESLEKQLKELNLWDERKDLMYHQLILENKLPQTIGGGIGQSRLCMFLLKKSHIAQVQSGYFPHTDNIPDKL